MFFAGDKGEQNITLNKAMPVYILGPIIDEAPCSSRKQRIVTKHHQQQNTAEIAGTD